MASVEDRLASVELQLRTISNQLFQTTRVANALEGRPSDATLSLPHNDSWLFEDNVDGSHPANLRYVIAANTQRVVSARLSIKLAPYRTYNSFSALSTAGQSQNHHHPHAHGSHGHSIPINAGPFSNAAGWDGGNFIGTGGGTAPTNSATPSSDSTAADVDHTHLISGSSSLGVTEGTTASGVAISFDGVSQTVALGGPFNADQIELNVRPYIAITQGVWHVIALQPSGLGRIEAHLRLGVYVSAGQVV